MQKPTRALSETPSCNNDYLGITFSITELNAFSQNGWIHAHIHPSIHSSIHPSILDFFFYTLMTFVMILSVILISMLMMTYEILKTVAGSDLLISVLQKFNQFFLMVSFAVDLKMDGPIYEGKSSFKMLGLSLSSKFGLGLLHCPYY